MNFIKIKKTLALSTHTSLVIVLLGLLLLSGCGSVVTKDTLKLVKRDISPLKVQTSPNEFINDTILWGGVIVDVKNLTEATEIEIFQTKLASDDRPLNTVPEGFGRRFIIRAPGFLDKLVYKERKKLTVAGTIIGIERRKIGDALYPYPIIEPLELHLFESYREREHDNFYPNYPYWPYFSPFDPYAPYYPYYWPVGGGLYRPYY
jgi:outer membrane lipoprotein